MSYSKAGGALNAALRLHAAGDVKKATTQAKTFFTYVGKLAAVKFSGKESSVESFFPAFSMTPAEIKLMNELAGRKVEVKVAAPEAPKLVTSKPQKTSGSARDICYAVFAEIDMADSAARKAAINEVVEKHGLAKPTVQSYASNFRAGK